MLMKKFDYSLSKNLWLIENRGFGFEDMIELIAKGNCMDVVEHPNQEKYPNQKIFLINNQGYAYMMPFIETENSIFLKTIIPSRKMTKEYLK